MQVERIENGWIYGRCECGNALCVKEPPAGKMYECLYGIAIGTRCDTCAEAERRREEDEARKYRLADLAATLPERLADAGVPERFASLDNPPMREVAVWIWEHRANNIVLNGFSGSGKTTSAIVCMRNLMRKADLRARYCQFSELADRYVVAKRGDEDKTSRFWWWVCSLDLLIVDETAGRRGYGKLSPAGQELFCGLVDRVYSRQFRGRLWMLGNFYAGTLAALLDDARPVLRRMSESFIGGKIADGKVESTEFAEKRAQTTETAKGGSYMG